MNAAQLIKSLKNQDIYLYLDGGKLKVNAPDGALTSEMLDSIRINKDDVIRFLSSAGNASTEAYDNNIPVVDRSKPVPLSYSQQRLWFLEQLNPDAHAYNMCGAFRITGQLDNVLLRSAFLHVVQRHESLRTIFVSDNKTQAQKIIDYKNWDLPLIDKSDRDSGGQDLFISSFCEEEAHRRFDLFDGPLFRTTLIKQSEHLHTLVMSMHHIISDGWSVEILLKELKVIYRSLVDNTAPLLPKLPIQYADFAAWQRGWLQGEVLDRQVEYWKDKLTGAPALLHLPTDRPRPQVQSFNGSVYEFELDRDLTQGLSKLATSHDSTLFMVLLAGYNILLSKYSGQQDVCVGIPVAGRNHAQIEDLIGFFINALVIRSDLSNGKEITDLIEQVKESTLGAFAHQDIPAEMLLDALQVQRSLSYGPLTQVGFTLQNIPVQNKKQSESLEGLDIELIKAEHVTAKYDLTLLLTESETGLQGVAEYSTDLFDASTIERMMQHYKNILQEMVVAPHEQIDTLRITDDKELYSALGIDLDQYSAILPLTAMQRDIYLATLVDPDTLQNSLGYAIEVHSELDLNIYQQELQRYVDSQGIFRTEVIPCDKPYADVAYQCVLKQKQVEIEFIDLSGKEFSKEEYTQERIKLRKEKIYRKYDPQERYHIHNCIIKFAEDDYLIILATHHMLLDGVGFLQQLNYITSNYERRLKGEEPQIDVDIFADYIEYDRKHTDTASTIEFWQDKLKEVEGLHYRVSKPQAVERISKQLILDDDHYAQIKKYCRKQRITVAHYFKCLSGLMINLYCQAESDFVLSEFISGRPKGHNNGVGCYYQVLPYIFKKEHFAAHGPIEELFSYAKEYQKQSKNHQHLSLLQQKRLEKQGQLGFMYNYLHFYPKLNFLGKEEFVHQLIPDAQGQVQIAVKVVADSLNLYLDYSNDIFAEEGFLERLAQISEQIISSEHGINTGAQLNKDLSYQLPHDKDLTNSINATQRTCNTKSIVEQLHDIASQYPQNIAVKKGDQSISYEQLEQQSNQLADYLKEQEIGRGDMVCVCMEKGPDLMIALTGIIKSGAAYVPIEKSYPQERINYIVDDAKAKLLLEDIKNINLNKCSSGKPKVKNKEQDPFYMIYTSGSTGKPKGSLVSHKNEKNLLDWYIDEYNITENDRSIVISAIGFDLTQKNLWAPLLSGSQLIFTAREEYDTDQIINTIEQDRVSLINCAPTAFYPLVDQEQEDQLHKLNSLRVVLFGGEPINLKKLENWSEVTKAQLINMYGPTECTDISCAYSIENPKSYKEPIIPIGTPNANVRLYVLSDSHNLVPTGLEGELCVAGDSVGLGYHQRNSLTQEKFIQTNFESEKIYKTGDIVRQRADGNLEYVQRKDFQLKVRGQRIEPGEIEAALKAQDGVREALILAHDHSITAYVQVDKRQIEGGLNKEQIREGLRSYLPDYMLPNGYVEIEKWPLTPNGKIDREELAKRQVERSVEYAQAQTETQRQLVEIWKEVLNIEEVGIYDNFFELGGHSLLATQIVSRVRDHCNQDLELRAIFATPTIAALAYLLDGSSAEVDAQIITPASREEELVLSYAQSRLWFLDQLNPDSSSFNMSAPIRLSGDLDKNALEQAFNEIIARHEVLRTRFVSHEGHPIQIIDPVQPLKLEVEMLEAVLDKALNKDSAEQQVQEIALTEAAQDMDLLTGPLLKVRLIKLDEQEHILIATMHHIISDGWSVAVLFKELVELYSSFKNNQSCLLPKLPIQYADFAAWERGWLQGEVLERQVEYWKDKLTGAPELLHLPTDRSRPQVQSFNGAVCEFELDRDLTQGLSKLATAHDSTLFMVLLAGYNILLSKYSGQQDICVGIPVAGRNHAQVEDLIGFFINALVIRSDLSDGKQINALIEQVKESTLGAFAHQDIPAEMLLDALQVQRSLSYGPLAQVGFTLQNIPVQNKKQSESLEGLDIELIKAEHVTAKYDLTLLLTESEDGLHGVAEYSTDLFDATSIETMMQHYKNILQKMVVAPYEQIDILRITDDKELYSALEIDPDQYSAILPLTAMQRDIYLATLVDPDTLQNSLGYAIEVHSELDLEIYQHELQRYVDSQGIFRTEVISCDKPYADVAYQCVLKQKQVEIEFIDLSDKEFTEDEYTKERQRLKQEKIYRKYDLKDRYHIHNVIIKFAADDYLIILATHHMLLDGVGFLQQLSYITSNYEHRLNNEETQIDTDIFADYVEYDRKHTDTASTIEYWQHKLKDVEGLHYRVSKPQNPKRASKQLTLDNEHYAQIKKYCRKQRITVAHYFKCLSGLMINLYCRAESDFVLSEFISGRPKGHNAGVGCYYQVLPYIFKKEHFTANSPIEELFSYAKEYQRQSKNHQHLSLLQQKRLEKQGQLGFMYNYLHFYPKLNFLGKEEFVHQLIPDAAGQVQIAVKVVADSLNLYLDYSNEIFAEEGFLERLAQISEQIINAEEALFTHKLSYQLPHDKDLLLKINATQRTYNTKSIVEQLHDIASQYPQNIAVKKTAGAGKEEQSISYQLLEQKSNQLAHYLKQQGVGTGDMVCVCMEKGPDLMIALTGIIKSGAAYVPIEKNYPQERINYIVADANAKLLLKDIQNINLNKYSSGKLEVKNKEQDPFYMIYTSGSTGKPKGSLVSHKNEKNLLDWYIDAYQITPQDKTLVISAIGFDLTQKNLWAPLLSGSQLIFTAREEYDTDQIINTIEQDRVSLINCAPTAFYPLVDEEQKDQLHKLESLRSVLFGGEPINLNKLQNWAQTTDAKLINMYGPTECTDISCAYSIENPKSYKEPIIPIGTPNANVRLYVLSDSHNLVPTGLEGELCVAGDSVGLGYHQRNSLTQEKFIQTNFESEKIYKTGDIVRQRADGNLEYVQRKDFQLKVRGQRIEPGEIEAALKAQDGVREALILAHDHSITAYVQVDKSQIEGGLNKEQIREGLRNYLPDYMLPNGYVEIEKWPLTPNGKIDREELAKRQVERRVEYAQAETETQRQLLEIWKDVLNVEQIGIYDNFFELGGHSLMGVKLLSRIEKEMTSKLPLSSLFAAQNIAQLSELIDNNESSAWSPLVTLKDDGNGAPLFLMHPGYGLVFSYKPIARYLNSDFPVYAIQAFGLEEGQDPIQDLVDMASYYINVMKTKQPRGPYRIAGHCFGGLVAYEVAQQLIAQGEKVELGLMNTFHTEQVLSLVDGSRSVDTVLLFALFGENAAQHKGKYLSLNPKQQVKYLYELALKAGMVYPGLNVALSERILEIVRTNTMMALQYKIKPYKGDITYFAAEECLEYELHSGWEKITQGKFKQTIVSGSHEGMLDEENAADLAIKITRWIDESGSN